MTGPTSTHSDQNPVSGMAVTPSPATERRERIRACSNCLRNARTDTIPAQQIGTYPVPAFRICGYCGWATEIEETA